MTAPDPADRIVVHAGDLFDVLPTMPDASVDAVVTDPPYGLGFMGRAWDGPGGDAAEFGEWCRRWAVECLRVLKPGGHLLAFGGTRTWHRLAVAVEDAGFEVRDSIAWLYAQGFPKSLDVAKAVDRLDAAAERRQRALEFTAWMRGTGVTVDQVNAATGTRMGSHYLTDREQPAVATADLFDRLRPLLPPVPDRIERLVADRTVQSANYAAREVIGERTTGRGTGRGGVPVIPDGDRTLTAPHTDEARAWQGWGTALKPAFEPVVVARKPLAGTVARNVTTHGTGALNIDGCRVGMTDADRERLTEWHTRYAGRKYADGSTYARGMGDVQPPHPAGRWPTNVVLDGPTADRLDREAPDTGAQGRASGPTRSGPSTRGSMAGAFTGTDDDPPFYGDRGGASRIFPVFRYEPKAPTRERPHVDGVGHVTVKPLALMRWLVRLVTPPGGVVLDPFAGSGTTGEACLREGMRAVLIEREPGYLPLIEARIAAVREGIPRRRTGVLGELTLFDEPRDVDDDGEVSA